MFKLMDKARLLEDSGRDIIHLEIGDPDFRTPPNVVEAAKSSLDAGEHHYTSSWGMPEFLEAVRTATLHSRRFLPESGQVLTTPGANVGIFYAVFCIVDPGQEVLIPDPGFPTYVSAIRACGAVPTAYPLRSSNAFQIRAADIEPLITDRTRLLVLNTPQNPTGAVTSETHLREIFELAERHDLYIYSDEIYSRMTYGVERFFSIAELDRCMERVILSNGFSKAFAMTGWRLGALVAPPQIAERMMLLLQTTASCVPPFIQRAGIEAIEGDQAAVHTMMAEYEARRDLLVQGLNAIPGVTCHLPGGAFYAFPDISSFGLSSQEFADRMLESAGVALLPGSNFGSQGEGFIRICYAASQPRLSEALERMASACQEM